MKKENKQEELQSRREFFKSAAKAALPIFGIALFATSPLKVFSQYPSRIGESSFDAINTRTGECMTCAHSCTGCQGTCSGSCRGDCSGGSQGQPSYSGYGTQTGCDWDCTQGCAGGCSGTCFRSCRTGCDGYSYY